MEAAPEPLVALQVACDQKLSYALLNDGRVRAWGNNDHGALGNGAKGQDSATPVEVQSLSPATAIEAGGSTGAQIACAIARDGAVSCWGSGASPMPTLARTDRERPTAIPELTGTVQLSLGSDGHGCAVTPAGTARCWGNNRFGELGTGDTQARRLPEPVVGVAGVREIRAGADHTCALLDDGSVKCWGSNATGCVHPSEQLGEPVLHPIDVGVTGALQLAIGATTSCALAGGALVCWGGRAGGALGRVEGLEAPTAVAANGDDWCAIDQGAVKCWGRNQWGQAGSGTRDEVVLPAVVAGLTGATSISLGERHACAVVTGGAAWCWGYNQRGELGDGTLRDRARPVAVVGLLDATLAPPSNGYGDVEEAAAAQDWRDLPKACTHDDELALRHPHIALTSLAVRSAYARQLDATSLELRIASYRMDPANLLWDEPRGAGLKLSASFRHVEPHGTARRGVDIGRYSLDPTGERRVVTAIHTRSQSHVVANDGQDDGGAIELRYLDRDWICGHVELRTKTGDVRGEFAARVVR